MIVKTVGRGLDNDFVINDDVVSRVHLQLVKDDNGNISVVDLGSTNGTFVNGNRITGETRLKSGDKLRIGDTLLPWETYFPKIETPLPPQPQKRKMTWLYIVCAVFLVLLIGGIVLLLVNDKKEIEKERIEQEQKDKLLMDIKDQDYKNLKDKKREAELDAQAEKEKRVEDSRRYVAEKQKAEKKADEATKKAVNELKKEKSSVERERDSVRKESDSVKKERDSAKEEAQKAAAKAEENAKIAKEHEEATKLTSEFYQELNKAQNEKKLKEVCTALGINEAKSDERYNKIVSKFNSAKDNAARRKIIDTIKKTEKKTLLGKGQDVPKEGEK